MEFRLHYRGKLKSSSGNGDGTSEHKHKIRKELHKQMKTLWHQMPLKNYLSILKEDEPLLEEYENFLRQYGKKTKYNGKLPQFLRKPNGVEAFTFVPLVNTETKLIAELEIVLLRKEEPGIMKGSDLDNQLKTLFDALRMPQSKEEVTEIAPGENEQPFFCLLEDDKLITRLVVESDRLLEETTENNEVELLIRVRTKLTNATVDYFALGL